MIPPAYPLVKLVNGEIKEPSDVELILFVPNRRLLGLLSVPELAPKLLDLPTLLRILDFSSILDSFSLGTAFVNVSVVGKLYVSPSKAEIGIRF